MIIKKAHILLGLGVFAVFVLVIISLTSSSNTFKNTYIPLDIWQTYKTRDLPKEAEKCQQTWVNQKNIKYHFMSDPDIEQFVRNHYPDDVYRVFIKLPLGVMRADLWRYCILYKYGGIYSDIDSKLLRPIETWDFKKGDRIIIGLENDIHFCQWTIASVPNHPILKNVIQMIVDEFNKGIDLTNEHFVHKHTGPGIWTRAINKTLGFNLNQKAIDTWKLYKEPKHKRKFTKLGIRLESRDFFNREYVQNLYGSTQFRDEAYNSWVKERDEIRARLLK